MILLRGVQDSDLDSLLRFAQIPGMFNLPGDRDALQDRIAKSKASFKNQTLPIPKTKYTFVAQDLKTGQVLATSMVAGQHGTPESPHFYFQVSHEKRFSETINTGFIHGTLTLNYDTEGPSEIGALVVDPEFRNHEERVGRQISFVRFLYIANHRKRFMDRIIAELLPPLNKRGLSPLWEAVGRRFTSMDYWEADQLCAKNKDFIFDLFPSGKIYTTFLPAEARNAIGKVGKETEPVFHMLKKIGFDYKNQVDPFDGGPHLWCDTDRVAPIRKTQTCVWSDKAADGKLEFTDGLLTKAGETDEFRALAVSAHIDGDRITVKKTSDTSPAKIAEILRLQNGDSVLFMPYY